MTRKEKQETRRRAGAEVGYRKRGGVSRIQSHLFTDLPRKPTVVPSEAGGKRAKTISRFVFKAIFSGFLGLKHKRRLF